jgi:hypothetical protein
MKNLKINFGLTLLFILVSVLGFAQKSVPTSEVHFLSGDNRTVSLRAVGYGNNEENAIADAEHNAFHVLLFRGLPGSEQNMALIGTNEITIKEKNKEYFNVFFVDKRYKSFVMTSSPSSDLLKLKGGTKSIMVDIKINLIALHKDLEDQGIVRKFGY